MALTAEHKTWEDMLNGLAHDFEKAAELLREMADTIEGFSKEELDFLGDRLENIYNFSITDFRQGIESALDELYKNLVEKSHPPR